MKPTLSILLVLIVNLASCQTAKYDKVIVEKFTTMSVLDAPFMIDELIEIYKKDTLCIKKAFNSSIFDRTEYTRYCYNVCAEFFSKKLLEKKNSENGEIIDKIISDLDYNKSIIKPQINWETVFKTCQACPFGAYPDERFFYFKFSVMYMGEKEIKQMINYENGQQWKYALMAIKGGDSFTLSMDENYTQYVLDRRIASYIIERWKDSEIPEVQDLISTYKSVI